MSRLFPAPDWSSIPIIGTVVYDRYGSQYRVRARYLDLDTNEISLDVSGWNVNGLRPLSMFTLVVPSLDKMFAE